MPELGDAPIDQRYKQAMNDLAHDLDDIFNGGLKGEDRINGFILMVFPFHGNEGRCNYISNANRADVVIMLKEQLARFEGQPELKGHG